MSDPSFWLFLPFNTLAFLLVPFWEMVKSVGWGNVYNGAAILAVCWVVGYCILGYANRYVARLPRKPEVDSAASIPPFPKELAYLLLAMPPVAMLYKLADYLSSSWLNHGVMTLLGPTYDFSRKLFILLVLVGIAFWLFRLFPLFRRYVRKTLGSSAHPLRRARLLLDILVVITAMVAVGNYLYFGSVLKNHRYGSFYNNYEFYHYYIGTKYAPEVTYTDMYNATLIADRDTKPQLFSEKRKKTIRNLDTITSRPVKEVYAEADKYRKLFTPGRWQEFLKDTRFFKSKMNAARWSDMLNDKGYNSTPIWTMVVGGIFSNNFTTDQMWHMNFLALLDPILITTAMGVVIWTFGMRTAAMMLILLGISYVMHWSHMKGAYLRTDFTMTLIMAVCFIKQNHYKTAGALTAWAVCSRVFPAVFLFGLGAKVFWEVFPVLPRFYQDRQRVLARSNLYFMIAGALLVVAAGIAVVIRRALLSSQDVMTEAPWVSHFLVAAGLYIAVALALLFAGVCAIILWWNHQEKVISRRYYHYFGAFTVTVLTLFAVSIPYHGGLGLWKDFAMKIGKHNEGISTWRMGFKYIFMGDFTDRAALAKMTRPAPPPPIKAGEGQVTPAPAPQKLPAPVFPPSKHWQSAAELPQTPPAKEMTFSELAKKNLPNFVPMSASRWYVWHHVLFKCVQLAVLLFALLAARNLSDHRAMIFSFVPCFFLVSCTYYYYIMLLVPFMFFATRPERPARAASMSWMYITAVAGYFFYFWCAWSQEYATYYWTGWMILITVFSMMGMAIFQRRPKKYAAAMMGMTLLFGWILSRFWPLPDVPALVRGTNDLAYLKSLSPDLVGLLLLGVYVVALIALEYQSDLSKASPKTGTAEAA